MIIKGKSRGGPVQLARHLMRQDTNETVKILQLDSPTGSLREALRDWQFIASGTQGTRGLYHANISPDARYVMTPEQWMRTVDVLEKELKLDGQPRAIVFHEKEGRQHVHVVWQRTDIDTMKMVPDSFNYVAHERASLALELEFGHEHVAGKHAKRDREQEMPRAEITHAEWQQGERRGIDPREFKEAITAIYKACDSGQAFQAALDERGLLLAKGDRRDFVIVDDQSQVYSLARQIKGVTAKDLRAFMGDIDREKLPDVEQAKTLQHERAHSRAEAQTLASETAATPRPSEQAPPPSGISPEELAKLETALRARHEEEGQRLLERQQVERKWGGEALDREVADKMKDFDAVHSAELDRYDREHPVELRGFSGFMFAVKSWLNPAEAAAERQQREEARGKLIERQQGERKNQVETLNIVKESELKDIDDRHAQQQREHAARFDPERARYIREHEASQRLLAEIEERRRQQELNADQQQTRDGPDPPGLTR